MPVISNPQNHHLMVKDNYLILAQEYDKSQYFNLSMVPAGIEPYYNSLETFIHCGWRLNRKVTYLGSDLIKYIMRVKFPNKFRYIYYLEYFGNKKCMRIDKNKHILATEPCDGKNCLIDDVKNCYHY
jgi:hypothetical protein